MPNQQNNAEKDIIHQGIIIFFSQQQFEFDKNANSINVSMQVCPYVELVWRLSEFAFFVRLLR